MTSGSHSVPEHVNIWETFGTFVFQNIRSNSGKMEGSAAVVVPRGRRRNLKGIYSLLSFFIS